MQYPIALELKRSISDWRLNQRINRASTISFAAGTNASALNINKALQGGINGIGITRQRMGEEACIKLLTQSQMRISQQALFQYFNLQKGDIVIEHVGQITFKHFTEKHRPPFPGISIGHYQNSAGTLGCFAEDARGDRYIISNNHVLANVNKSTFADQVLQPGPSDGGQYGKDEIAQLADFVEVNFRKPNSMDAAIAKIYDSLNFNPAIDGRQPVTGVTPVRSHLRVEKFGRTTGHTTGVITTCHLDLQVSVNGKPVEFENQFEIKGTVVKRKRIPFCFSGDSGALIMEQGTGNAVGLLFAGADDGTTFATPIQEVLDAFSLKIL